MKRLLNATGISFVRKNDSSLTYLLRFVWLSSGPHRPPSTHHIMKVLSVLAALKLPANAYGLFINRGALMVEIFVL